MHLSFPLLFHEFLARKYFFFGNGFPESRRLGQVCSLPSFPLVLWPKDQEYARRERGKVGQSLFALLWDREGRGKKVLTNIFSNERAPKWELWKPFLVPFWDGGEGGDRAFAFGREGG